MERVAKFEKVPFEEFKSSLENLNYRISEDEVERIYDGICLPERMTNGSAGYDFASSIGAIISHGKSLTIPTGIRCKIQPGWVLSLYPRSGMGFKFRIQLDNTVGIIDSDYYGSDNYGHIMIRIHNDDINKRFFHLEKGVRFAQGIFTPFGITEDDFCNQEYRNGAFGSTGSGV